MSRDASAVDLPTLAANLNPPDATATNRLSLLSSINKILPPKAFDDQFRYKRRIKHLTPIFSRVDFSMFNSIQLFVLLAEFCQLASFPLRDLFRSDNFQKSLVEAQGGGIAVAIETIRSVFAALSTGIVSNDINFVKFVLAWWITICGLLIAGVFTIMHFGVRTEMARSYLHRGLRRWIKRMTVAPWVSYRGGRIAFKFAFVVLKRIV